MASKATIVGYTVMNCETGVALTSTIVAALDGVKADAETYPLRKIVVNLSNGATGAADSASIKVAEDLLFATGNVVIIRAA
eukprot:Awhi_evm1s6923